MFLAAGGTALLAFFLSFVLILKKEKKLLISPYIPPFNPYTYGGSTQGQGQVADFSATNFT
jgi:hypothetical protein